MFAGLGRYSGNVIGADIPAFGFELLEYALHVGCITVSNGIESEAERSRSFFLTLPIEFADFPPFAVTDASGQTVAKLLTVKLDRNAPPSFPVCGESEDMQRLDGPAQFSRGFGGCGGAFAHLQRPHDRACMDMSRLQRFGQTLPCHRDGVACIAGVGNRGIGLQACHRSAPFRPRPEAFEICVREHSTTPGIQGQERRRTGRTWKSSGLRRESSRIRTDQTRKMSFSFNALENCGSP